MPTDADGTKLVDIKDCTYDAARTDSERQRREARNPRAGSYYKVARELVDFPLNQSPI